MQRSLMPAFICTVMKDEVGVAKFIGLLQVLCSHTVYTEQYISP